MRPLGPPALFAVHIALCLAVCLGSIQPAVALAPSDSGLHEDAAADDAAAEDASAEDASVEDAASSGDPAPPIHIHRPDASDERPVIRILPPSPGSSPPAARPHLGTRDGGVAPLSTARPPRHAVPRAADAGAPTQTWVKGLEATEDGEVMVDDVGCRATGVSSTSLPLMSVLGVLALLVRRRSFHAR